MSRFVDRVMPAYSTFQPTVRRSSTVGRSFGQPRRNCLAALKAIGGGCHTLSEISNESLIGTTHLSFYLATLQELRLVERRIPVTVESAMRRKSRQGRYHLSDPYFRFYFRFLDPHHDVLTPICTKEKGDFPSGRSPFQVAHTGFEPVSVP
jgi:AAA+ ATPase superfamily predicted ATPase